MTVSLTHDPPMGAADDLGTTFDLYSRDLLRYAAQRVGTEAAEDVVAQTFLIAHEKRAKFDSARGELKLWLYGICTNVLRSYKRAELRRLRSLAVSNSDVESPENRSVARLDAARTVSQVSGVLARMPRRQREVLVLFAIAELDYREIAMALGIPVGSVQSALHRARAKVRAALTSGVSDE